MKKLLLSAVILFISSIASAQVTIAEPSFEQEAVIVKSETEGIEIEIEHAKIKKTENIGTALLFGVGNQSTYYELPNPKSKTTLSNECYDKDLQFILSWSDNKRSPKRLFQIVPLEIQKKRRIYNVGKYKVVTGVETQANQGYINFTAVKYGEYSYLVTIPKDELLKVRDNNFGEVEKFGKQYVIRLLNSSAQNLSDTEDFLTFGIDIPTKEQLNLMKSFNKKEKDGEDANEEMNNEETDDLV